MCGVAGLLQFTPTFSKEEIEQRLNQMASQMHHRGPDDHGLWVHPSLSCGFAHRRLSIVDLSQAGHQPMTSLDGRYVITFNGEIYNFLELRSELERSGITFQSRTDTEVLLEAYRRWGQDMLLKLDGMFAFAIYDKETRETFIARDPFGEKPLYFAQNSNFFAFCSELKPLLCIPQVSDAIGIEEVAEYLSFQYIGEDRTIFRSIRKLKPAHFMRISHEGQVTIERYFEFRPENTEPRLHSLNDLADELEDLLIRSLKRRLIADVPIGAFLSGGVDSSLTVALATRKLNTNIKTFSIGFENTPESEHFFARQFAKHLGTDHFDEMIEPRRIDFAQELGSLLDEPNADTSCLPTYALARLARKHVTVALTGDAGDELFGGYGRYFSTLHDVGRRDQNLLYSKNFEGHVYYSQRILLFDEFQICDILGFLPSGLNQRLNALRSSLSIRNKHLLSRLRHTDFENYLPGAVLAKVDRMTMLHSLEARTPFLNLDIIRFAESLPAHHLVQGDQGKLILKQIGSRYLPKEWLYRKKMGFGLPFTGWAQQQAVTAFQDSCCQPNSRIAEWIDRKKLEQFARLQSDPSQFSLYRIWPFLVLESYLRANRSHSDVGLNIPSLGTHANSYPTPVQDNDIFAPVAGTEFDFIHVYIQGHAPSWVSTLKNRACVHSMNPLLGNSNIVVEDWVQNWAKNFHSSDKKHRVCHIFPHGIPQALSPFTIPANHSVIYKAGDAWFSFISSNKMPVWKIIKFTATMLLRCFGHSLSRKGRVWTYLFNSSYQPPKLLPLENLALFENWRPLPERSGSTAVRYQYPGLYFEESNSIISLDRSDPNNNGRSYLALKHHVAPGSYIYRAMRRLDRFWYGVINSENIERFGRALSELVQLKNERLKDNGVSQIRKCSLLISSLGSGGAERQIATLATALAKQNIEVSLIVLHPLADKQFNDYLHLIADYPGIRLVDGSIRTSTFDPSKFNTFCSDKEYELARVTIQSMPPDSGDAVARVLPHLCEFRPDIMVSFLDEPNIIGSIAAIIANVPKVLVSFRNFAPNNFSFHRPYHRIGYQTLLEYRGLHACSNSLAGLDDYFKWIGKESCKKHYTPNGVDEGQFYPMPTHERMSVREKLGLDAERKIILGAFRLSGEKNPVRFVEAAEQILARNIDCLFVVVGVGPLESAVKDLCWRKGIQDAFLFLGRMNNMNEIYNMADLVLLTSDFEGTPNVLLEAQLCGIPVVATDAGDSRHCFIPDTTGKLCAKDPHLVATACIDILSRNSVFKENSRTLGRAHVLNSFSRTRMLDAFFSAISVG